MQYLEYVACYLPQGSSWNLLSDNLLPETEKEVCETTKILPPSYRLIAEVEESCRIVRVSGLRVQSTSISWSNAQDLK